jgi:hypothetical protein
LRAQVAWLSKCAAKLKGNSVWSVDRCMSFDSEVVMEGRSDQAVAHELSVRVTACYYLVNAVVAGDECLPVAASAGPSIASGLMPPVLEISHSNIRICVDGVHPSFRRAGGGDGPVAPVTTWVNVLPALGRCNWHGPWLHFVGCNSHQTTVSASGGRDAASRKILCMYRLMR